VRDPQTSFQRRDAEKDAAITHHWGIDRALVPSE
jgi:hypothetical protein